MAGRRSSVRDYSNWHPDNIPTAVVWARCAFHPLTALAAWATFTSGRITIWDASGYLRPESVGTGAVSGTPEGDAVVRRFIEDGSAFGEGNLPVANPADDEEPYWREILECPRHSCNYRAEIGRRGGEMIRTLLRTLADSHGQVTPTSPNDTPAVHLEFHEFMRDPAAIYSLIDGASYPSSGEPEG
ncbi:hypothetical protein GCM10027425_12270 [Alteromonas gracilis]